MIPVIHAPNYGDHRNIFQNIEKSNGKAKKDFVKKTAVSGTKSFNKKLRSIRKSSKKKVTFPENGVY